MKKRILDISSSGGKINKAAGYDRIREYMNPIIPAFIKEEDIAARQAWEQEKLGSETPGRKLPIGKEFPREVLDPIDAFMKQVNQDIHYLGKRLSEITMIKSEKRAKRTLDYPAEIEKTALLFQELVRKAPYKISNNFELDELSNSLSVVPRILDELRADPVLEIFGIDYPVDRSSERKLRVEFVEATHALYTLFTKGKERDWVNYDAHEDDYTNPFFHLIKLCYESVGIKVKPSTISADIMKAKIPN